MLDARPVRFLIAGVANTAVGLAAYAIAELAGTPVWGALLIGMVTGVAFSFFSMGAYAFRDLSWQRLPRFLVCYGANYLVNLLALAALQRFVADPILRQALLTPPMAAFSYICLSRFVFQRPKPD
ncbi:MAG TPA: GtrA family protein [Burkholderiaceae bacterium]|jgi:putative flippase GtrA|nr:GtrA family protein [Burkholderiaceae bacterium]